MVRPKSTLKLGRANLAPLEPNYSTMNMNSNIHVKQMENGPLCLPEAEYGVTYGPALHFDPDSIRQMQGN